MDDVRPKYDDEVDLIAIFEILWNDKLKIIVISIVFLLGAFGYQMTLPPPDIKATTEIKILTSNEFEKFRPFNLYISQLREKNNEMGFLEITPSRLFNLYIEQLGVSNVFEEAIRKLDKIDAAKYENEEEFNRAVLSLVSAIEVNSIIRNDQIKEEDLLPLVTISFTHKDIELWKEILSSVNILITKSVQDILQRHFQTTLFSAHQENKFKIADISIQIENSLTDYERKTSDRLAFLKEQYAMAKELDIEKSTIEMRTFPTINSLFANYSANYRTDTTYYLRGYEAIGKEIELIQSRKDKHSFIDGLLQLEQKKRALEQNKTLARVESLFNSTPIVSKNNFLAVSVNFEATNYESLNNINRLMLPLSFILGIILASIYVLISNSMRKRKEQ